MPLPAEEWTRASLSAGPLRSFGFRIETRMGDRPMTYLFARASLDRGRRAISRLVIEEPANLRRTRVDIVEDLGADHPHVIVELPTMRAPRVIDGGHLFDCLPLTDVGYLDLMAWTHPASTPVDPTACAVPADVLACANGTQVRRSSAPELDFDVVEYIDVGTGVTVGRSVSHGGVQTRTWRVLALGSAAHGHLPSSIRATRSASGHSTEFVRTSDPCPVPEGCFEQDADSFLGIVGREVSR